MPAVPFDCIYCRHPLVGDEEDVVEAHHQRVVDVQDRVEESHFGSGRLAVEEDMVGSVDCCRSC